MSHRCRCIQIEPVVTSQFCGLIYLPGSFILLRLVKIPFTELQSTTEIHLFSKQAVGF